MRNFMTSGAHRNVMPKLLDWCDEASVAHWHQTEQDFPSWEEVAHRMRVEGRASKVHHPSLTHERLAFDPPRTAGAASIKPKI
jgi:hypothetical protein